MNGEGRAAIREVVANAILHGHRLDDQKKCVTSFGPRTR